MPMGNQPPQERVSILQMPKIPSELYNRYTYTKVNAKPVETDVGDIVILVT